MRHTDKQLLKHLHVLRNRERATCVEILLDLVQVERRKLHAALGYSSLFAFATRHLRYSESAAGRRVQATRCVRDHPEVISLLRRGAANLSTISLVSRVLTGANKKALLAQIAGKSQREVEAVVAQNAPARRVRDRIRAVSVPRAEQENRLARYGGAALGLETSAKRAPMTGQGAPPENRSRSGSEPGKSKSLGRETGPAPGEPHRATGHSMTKRAIAERAMAERSAMKRAGDNVVGTAIDDSRGVSSGSNDFETRFKIQFAAGVEFIRKFEEARALLSGRYPKGASIESVFEAGLDAFLERKSPARRSERRKAREKKRVARIAQRTATQTIESVAHQAADRSLPLRELSVERPVGESVAQPVQPVQPAQPAQPVEPLVGQSAGEPSHVRRRAVPVAIRDAIFERDGGCCSFLGVDGRRCGSRHDVEVDHCQPVARGGTNTVDNLRLLCAVHNRLEAERVFGSTWMRRFGRS